MAAVGGAEWTAPGADDDGTWPAGHGGWGADAESEGITLGEPTVIGPPRAEPARGPGPWLVPPKASRADVGPVLRYSLL